MADSPGSPLSSHASSEFADDVKFDEREQSVDSLPESGDVHLMPPSKRQKLGQFSYRSTPASQLEAPDDEDGDISSDSSASIPSSELGTIDEDYEQVTFCKWEDCEAGDLGNMDELVHHIHEDHIGTRQKKYTCEWQGCIRQGHNHASGYALKAHMRSHTKEKPFMCFLPECDRSFTRSDALAKHMRTVHETETLRPSDPVPRSHANQKPQRIKLFVRDPPPPDGSSNHLEIPLSSPHSNGGGVGVGHLENSLAQIPENASDEDVTMNDDDDATLPPSSSPSPYPSSMALSPTSASMPPSQLFRLLRRQVRWTEQENEALKQEVIGLEKKRKEEWTRKELVLLNVFEAEVSCAAAAGGDVNEVMRVGDDLPVPMLPISGKTPWYRVRDGQGPAEKAKERDVGKWVDGIRQEDGRKREARAEVSEDEVA
ncbi:MAG: hypothetical protein LQ351_006026 [Letrouitia transgressa]|nr:MAG: hypothetical protein LQ351_006026 [Letrouitia transgressa]